MTEEFRPIKDFERYYVSNLGRVINTETGKFLKMREDKDKYFYVGLCKNGKEKLFRVHRLVAQAFISNPENLETIDHVNGLKTDNRVENLQWLSAKENVKRFHREQATEEQKEFYRKNLIRIQQKAIESRKKPIICTDSGVIYNSITEASKLLKIDRTCIIDVLQKRQKHTHGLHFKYLLE